MIHALTLSLAQMGDRKILAVLAKSLSVTLVLFVIAGAGVWWGTEALLDQWLGASAGGVATLIALFVTVMALWLLFRAVAIGVVGIFADDVVEAVEAKHYPAALKTAKPVSLGKAAAMGLRSGGRVVIVNLLLLPVYITLLVTGVGTAILFIVVNGWLLGRDLGDMVAVRHMDAAAMRGWRKATGVARFVLGLAVAVLFVVPVANILAPVLGAAMATHLFHTRLLRKGQP